MKNIIILSIFTFINFAQGFFIGKYCQPPVKLKVHTRAPYTFENSSKDIIVHFFTYVEPLKQNERVECTCEHMTDERYCKEAKCYVRPKNMKTPKFSFIRWYASMSI